MAHNIVMPALEMAQETGKLVAWRKKEGQSVSKGEPLFDVETDKAVVEIEAPGNGILAGIRAREGDVIPVGQTIAWLVAPGEIPPSEAMLSGTGRRMTGDTERASAMAAKLTEATTAQHLKISPKARRLAKEHGINIADLRGSGPEGEVLAEDVLALADKSASKSASPVPATSGAIESVSSIARLMAERTTQSWTSVPHFFVVREIDAGGMLAAREKIESAREKHQGGKLTITDILIAGVARGLREHPRLNASWLDGNIRVNTGINVAVAIAVNDGVVTVVIPDADKKSLPEVATLRSELTGRARAGRLHPADIGGATFTISNLGMYKVDAFSAIIIAPQAAILAVGAITDRVVARNGVPAVRPMLTMTLSSDHRVVDGARAALFLNDLAEALSFPEKWLQ
jgi:pyruvate dehydrogenase E2 component (dihydrolipoamide acetyltransferase)